MQGHKGKSKWIKDGLADRKARKYFNHGQKSWDTFCISGAFFNSHRPKPPLTPQTMLDMRMHNFSQVSTLYKVGGRKN